MTEEKKAKNPDYTGSAENLCNPPSVFALLNSLHEVQGQVAELESELAQNEKYRRLAEAQQQIVTLQEQLKEMVDQQGSYQDVSMGIYAVKYRKVSKSYDAGRFKDTYPEYARAVVVEAVNTGVG